MQLSPDFETLRGWVEQLPETFSNTGTELYRGRNVLKAFEVEGQTVVVKRFKRLDLLKGIIYTWFRPGKARRSYQNAVQLRERGIDSPIPIAYLEIKEGLLMRDSYYVCAHTDYEELSTQMPVYCTSYPPALARAFAQFVSRLHLAGILHYDLNNGNVLYREREEGGYDFQLIDINRMKFMPAGEPVSLEESKENLTLFTGNLELHAFVVREYALARGLDPESFVPQAVAVKRRHDLRWRRRKLITHPNRWFK